MILDDLANARRYYALHPLFARAFEFLAAGERNQLPNGRHEIDVGRLLALIDRPTGRGRAKSPLEAHRRYIDIQFVAAGHEEIGWRPRHECVQVAEPYDESRDIEFFADAPLAWLTLSPGQFAVFFPEDAHAPLAGEGECHKLVLKVALT